MNATVWVLFIYLQAQGHWLPTPLNVATKSECEATGRELVSISQGTTKNVERFVCGQVAEDDAAEFLDDEDE